MTINFKNLAYIRLPSERLCYSEIVRSEKEVRQELLHTMQPLRDHDVFNTRFDNCCIYAKRYTPISASAAFQKEVYDFELCRAQYLKNVLAFAREKFQGEDHAEKKLFELAKRNLCAIDPALIGENRYDQQDWFYVKIYKVVSHFFWGNVCMWVNRDHIRTWAARHDILKWGAEQDPNRALDVPLDIPAVPTSGNGFVPKTRRDKIVKDIFLKEIGFQEEDINSLQGILKILPGRIQKFGFHPSTREAHIVLEKEWVARPNWEQIDKETKGKVPKIIAPISMLIEALQEKGTPIPDALKVIGNRLAIVPRVAHVRIAEVLNAKIIREETETRMEFEPGKLRVVIPATFGLLSPHIYVDVLAISRKSNGDLTIKVGTGGSTGFDTTIKGLAFALTKLFLKEGSATITLPPEGEERIVLPSEYELKEAHEGIEKYLRWDV